MTAQDYINQAVAAGIPRSAIDFFLSGNPNDEHRIMSALGPDYIHAAIQPAATVAYAPVSHYATPTPQVPIAGGSGGAFLPASTDAMLVAHTPDNITHPQLTVVDRTPADRGGGIMTTQIVPMPSAFPPWMLIAAVAIGAFVLLRR